MHPKPKFTTDEILLRPFTKEDAPALFEALNHPELSGRKYLPWEFDDELPLNMDIIEKIIEKWISTEDGFCYAVTLLETQEIIGHASAEWDWDPHMPDANVVIYPGAQRKGYGTQALTLLLDYLVDFTVGHNISAGVEEWNTAGIEFLKKLGFTRVGTIRRDEFRGGQYVDAALFDIIRPEWKERRHAA